MSHILLLGGRWLINNGNISFIPKKMSFVLVLGNVTFKISCWDFSTNSIFCVVFGFDQPCTILGYFIMSVTLCVTTWQTWGEKTLFSYCPPAILVSQKGLFLSLRQRQMQAPADDCESMSCVPKRNLRASAKI